MPSSSSTTFVFSPVLVVPAPLVLVAVPGLERFAVPGLERFAVEGLERLAVPGLERFAVEGLELLALPVPVVPPRPPLCDRLPAVDGRAERTAFSALPLPLGPAVCGLFLLLSVDLN